MTNSPIDTVTLLTLLFNATPAWLAGANAAGYQCRCTRACGKSHRAHAEQRCPVKSRATREPACTCTTALCTAPAASTRSPRPRKQADAQAQQAIAARYAQDDLLSLLADQ